MPDELRLAALRFLAPSELARRDDAVPPAPGLDGDMDAACASDL
jgi:hypothetical protein